LVGIASLLMAAVSPQALLEPISFPGEVRVQSRQCFGWDRPQQRSCVDSHRADYFTVGSSRAAVRNAGLAGYCKLVGPRGQGVQVDPEVNQQRNAGTVADRQQPSQQVGPVDVILAVALCHPQ